MVDLTILEIMSVVAVLVFLGIAARSDLRTREVSDSVWLVLGPAGAVLTASRILIHPALATLSTISIVLMTLISLGLFYFGLFGGADAKAFICIAATLPLSPSSIPSVLGYFHPFLPLAILYNSYLLALSGMIVPLAFNLERISAGRRIFEGFEHENAARKILAMLTGYAVSIPRLEFSKHMYPIEEILIRDGKPVRNFRLYVGADADRDRLVSELKSNSMLARVEYVWATPGLPFLAFVLAAVGLTLVLGDALIWLVFQLLTTLL